MRVTTLIEDENHDVLGLEAEKGLSPYIQRDDDSILFDNGTTGIFVENAEKLGVDLKDVEITAISHGHFDHRGGLRSIMK